MDLVIILTSFGHFVLWGWGDVSEGDDVYFLLQGLKGKFESDKTIAYG